VRTVIGLQVGYVPDRVVLKAQLNPAEGEPLEIVLAFEPRDMPKTAEALVDNAKEAIFAAAIAGEATEGHALVSEAIDP